MAIVPKKASLDNISGPTNRTPYKVPLPKEESGAEEEFKTNPQPAKEQVGRGFGADATKPSADDAEFMATKVTPNPVSISNEKTINYEGDKPKVVTKEQMQKAGFDNLRDYLNAQQGLKRRTNKYEDQGLDASGKGSAPLRNIPQLSNNGTNKMGTRDAPLKMVKLAKGGMARSPASKRADGCATKGFTKGRNL